MNVINHLLTFNALEAAAGDKLVGGFSASFLSLGESKNESETSNNCLGGNCATGCGVYGNNTRSCYNNLTPSCGS